MFYWIIVSIAGVIFRIIFRLKAKGRENIPKAGPVIICANHISIIDPASLAFCSRRSIRFIAKKELFKNPVGGWFFRRLNAIPVDRGGNDMAAYRASVSVLQGGGVLGIFAQGHRMKDGIDVKAAKAGVALFALKTGAAVVPARINATYRLFSRVSVSFGEPMTFEEYAGARIKSETLNDVTERIMTEITRLGEA